MRILLFTSINFSLGLRITSLQEYFHQHNALPVENYSQGIRNSLKQCLRQDHPKFLLMRRITSLQEYFHWHNAISAVRNYSLGIRNSLKYCSRQVLAIPLNEKVCVNTEAIGNFVCFNREMKKKP